MITRSSSKEALIDIFSRMIPFAAQHNIRLVALNRRDYPGSSPLSSDELIRLDSSDVLIRTAALRTLGGEIGAFLAWFVRTHDLPPVVTHVDGRRTGGIVLVAWSLAHTVTCSLLACPGALSETTRSALRTHLRTYCVLCSR